MKNISNKEIIIKDSPIHGKGVFANRDFKKGEVVLHWDTSHTLSEKDIKKIKKEEQDYICFFDGKCIIMQEPEKYINHSCEANTYTKDFCDIANRYIKRGEEITSDYSNQLEPNTCMECGCGSKKCKGIISG